MHIEPGQVLYMRELDNGYTCIQYVCKKDSLLTLSLTGVGPFGPSLAYMQISLKVLKVRYRQKLDIPQAGSYACIEISTVPILDLISL